jgi:hypothetical protein
MRIDVLYRMLVAVGLSAVVLIGLGVTTSAQGQREQGSPFWPPWWPESSSTS